jgi:hypothetical protein
MFVRIVNGRAYLAETERVGGRVVQRHIGPATPDLIAIVAMLAADREELRQVERQRRVEERERDRELAERWTMVRREFETTMRVAGYHNPNGRGWRKRRAAKSDR